MYEYNAQITGVVDGDTFDLDIDLGFHAHFHERVRVLDLDTPEKRGSEEKQYGLIVTEFARRNFLNRAVVISSKKELTPKTDSFGRWLVDVVIKEGPYVNQSVSDIYTSLGVNKYQPNYSTANVLLLSALMEQIPRA